MNAEGMSESDGSPVSSHEPRPSDLSSDGITVSDKPSASQGGHEYQAGQLTAGEFDDRLNEAAFRTFLKNAVESQGQSQSPIDWSIPNVQSLIPRFHDTTTATQAIDVAFAIDATGSMGDELNYLAVEFDAIVDAFSKAYPALTIRFGLVFYRDEGDAFITQSHAFTSSASQMKNKLKSVSAGGGGDFPEAMDQAVKAAQQLAWKGRDQAAQVLFLVADAPPHAENYSAFLKTSQAMAELGIHIYPIASSGIDKTTESLMRMAAYQSGGTYLFLTDDSGVGDSHLEPSIPCYIVTTLAKQISRVLNEEVQKKRIEPEASDILRKVGKYENGVCGES